MGAKAGIKIHRFYWLILTYIFDDKFANIGKQTIATNNTKHQK